MFEKSSKKMLIKLAKTELKKIQKEIDKFKSDKIKVEITSRDIKLKANISTDTKRALTEINYLFRKYREKINDDVIYTITCSSDSNEFKGKVSGKDVLNYVTELDAIEEKYGPVTDLIKEL